MFKVKKNEAFLNRPLKKHNSVSFKNEIRTLAYLKRHKMIEAFNILKVKVGTEFVVIEAQWRRLVKLVAPDISSSHLELLLRVSDEGQKGHVGKKPRPPLTFLCIKKWGWGWGWEAPKRDGVFFHFLKFANENVYWHSLLAASQWNEGPDAVS